MCVCVCVCVCVSERIVNQVLSVHACVCDVSPELKPHWGEVNLYYMYLYESVLYTLIRPVQAVNSNTQGHDLFPSNCTHTLAIDCTL